MKKTMALMALMTLTACDYVQRADLRSEQDDRLYRAAMEDYRSGRMDAAMAGFEKAVAKDPSNASARFQLACLLQDVKKDFIGAYCGYREYLMQQPSSDKAALAKSRLAVCEKGLAEALASKYGLNKAETFANELEAVRKDLLAAEARVKASEKNLGESQARVRVLSAEREHLLNVVKGVGSESEIAAGKPSVKEVKDLLEEEDEVSARPSILPPPQAEDEEVRPPFAATSSVATASVAEKKPDPAPAAPDRPKTYVVQEGDTLYGLSKRFYGTITMWKQIRDANKALISMDNRLKAGDTLVLP